MVLSHTSGFPNWRKGGWQKGGPLPVLFEPGAKFGYSGEGFLYLQRVVERVTGEPLEPLLRKRLLEPLGMRVSSYVWQRRFEKLAARGHNARGEPTKSRPRFREANAAFSLYTTPTEYARFLVEIIRKDRSASHSLSRRSVDAMLKRVVRATGRKPIQRRGAPSRAPVYWSLGWPMSKTASGERYHHGGANGERFRCFCEFDPKRGTGLVIMTNAAGGEALWRRLIAAVSEP
jgi:CubicO group peptidase (beta-lactamase class C family)